MLKYKDVLDFDDIETDGIFKRLQTSMNFTWFTEDMAHTLDYMLYFDRGDKIISPSFEQAIEKSDNNGGFSYMASVVTLKYKSNWDKLYNTYFNTTYNPLTNFKSVEDEGVATDLTQTSNVNNKRYGFNTTSQGKDTDSGVNSVTTSGDITKNKRHREVSGIAGKTNQELVKEEMDLRLTDFYEILIKNVDSVLLTGLWG